MITSINNILYFMYTTLIFTVHFISIKPVLSDHLSYVTIFHCSIARSHETGLTVVYVYESYIITLKTTMIRKYIIGSAHKNHLFWFQVLLNCHFKFHRTFQHYFIIAQNKPATNMLGINSKEAKWIKFYFKVNFSIMYISRCVSKIKILTAWS